MITLKKKVELLKKLSEAFGPPNNEAEVRNILRNELNHYSDTVREDNMGNVFFFKNGDPNKPTIMLTAHMDEVSFMVTYIDEEGFIRFHTLGGITAQVMPGQRILFRGKKGDVHAIIGTKPPHIMTQEERNKLVPIDDLFIDIGAENDDEVKQKGIEIGTVGVFDVRFIDLGNGYFRGKSFDDRAGCAVMVKVFQELNDRDYNIVAVGTVQEEVGLRGAKVAAWQVNPQYGLALEGTFAADVPGSKPHQMSSKLRSGPVITIADRTTLTHPKILNTLVKVAEKNQIPYQFKKIPSGGTDAGAIHLTKAGIPCGTVAVPCRYIHGPASILFEEDFTNTINLVKMFVAETSS